MSRDLTAGLGSDVAAPVVRPFFWLHIDFPDPVHAFTGTGTLTFADAEWVGIAGIAQIDTVTESSEGSATGIKATLFEVPSEFRDDIADQAVRGCAMELGIGSLDETFQVVRGIRTIRRAVLDTYEVTDNGATLSVVVTGEGRAIDQRRPTIKRYTDEYQQRRFAGDRFFQYVPRMATIPILWAKAEQNSAGGSAVAAQGGLSRLNAY